MQAILTSAAPSHRVAEEGARGPDPRPRQSQKLRDDLVGNDKSKRPGSPTWATGARGTLMLERPLVPVPASCADYGALGLRAPASDASCNASSRRVISSRVGLSSSRADRCAAVVAEVEASTDGRLAARRRRRHGSALGGVPAQSGWAAHARGRRCAPRFRRAGQGSRPQDQAGGARHHLSGQHDRHAFCRAIVVPWAQPARPQFP